MKCLRPMRESSHPGTRILMVSMRHLVVVFCNYHRFPISTFPTPAISVKWCNVIGAVIFDNWTVHQILTWNHVIGFSLESNQNCTLILSLALLNTAPESSVFFCLLENLIELQKEWCHSIMFSLGNSMKDLLVEFRNWLCTLKTLLTGMEFLLYSWVLIITKNIYFFILFIIMEEVLPKHKWFFKQWHEDSKIHCCTENVLLKL
jgi:hypothetical protein